jgi:diaminopimelate epimerase
MRFTKMQGIGNDYVYVDCFQEPFPSDPAALARRISDRHFGVGGDGLILICPSTVAAARMRMFNADGSEAEMCGNGIRCVAKYVHDHGISTEQRLAIETAAGVLALDLEVSDGRVQRVRVDMGEPMLAPGKIPTTLSGERIVNAALPLLAREPGPAWFADAGLDPRVTCVSMGNPHAVLFCRHVQKVPLAEIGPAIEHDRVFPKRINAHFVEVHAAGEVTIRTWERGSGITLACGTGAAAVSVAGVLTGRTERKIVAHLPGGDLELEWGLDNHVAMTGPAVEVFSGEFTE